MKRKDLVSALLKSESSHEGAGDVVRKAQRVSASSVRAMGLELDHLTQEANQADELRAQLATGLTVIELDPDLLEPSFITDRLAPTGDAQYLQLVESIKSEGQKIPILVRPHPTTSGSYQIAYGRRRWQAARELGIKVKAIVQTLSDAELVVAQGKENSERRNLSFIEKALFATNLDRAGFERSVINAALAVHTAEVSRLLAVVNAIPTDIINAIGPAPKAGRTRWLELAKHLEVKDASRIVADEIKRAQFAALGTDAKFTAILDELRRSRSRADETGSITNQNGETVVLVTHSGSRLRLSINNRALPGFGGYLISELPSLMHRFEEARATTIHRPEKN